jgi:HEPN domain-containing protein
MSGQNRVRAYVELAERGLRSANALFEAEQYEDATLFAQQIVERVARALLVHAGISFGTSHNLGQMAEALPQGHPFKNKIRNFDDLSTAVTAYRYPTAAGQLKGPPEIAHLRARLQEAEQLIREAKLFLYDPKRA